MKVLFDTNVLISRLGRGRKIDFNKILNSTARYTINKCNEYYNRLTRIRK